MDKFVNATEFKHFRLLKDDVAISPLLAEIDDQPELWTFDKSRQKNIRCQRETNTIHLRTAKKPFPPGINGNDVHESRRAKLSSTFPTVLGWVEAFANKTGGELGRVAIVKLLPHSTVYRHIDHGEYYRIRDRYHLVLRSPSGSPMNCGGEDVRMQEAQLWWFDNNTPHEAHNESDKGRIHIIFDVLPKHLVTKHGNQTSRNLRGIFAYLGQTLGLGSWVLNSGK